MKRRGMTRLVSLVLSLAVMMSAFAGLSVTAAAKSKWDGWLKITSAADLLRLKDSKNKFYLTKDIDLKGKLWNEEIYFYGTLDGNGYSIKNLTSTKYGLFYKLDNATIQNIGLYNIEIKSQKVSVGGFAAKAGGTTFKNCYATGSLEKTANDYAAGFVGSNYKSNYFENCVNMVKVKATGSAAGFECGTSGDFKNCINYGRIEGKSASGYVGGICNFAGGQMTSCYNVAVVINNHANYSGAGIAGYANNNAYMTNCATTTAIDVARAGSTCLAQADTGVSSKKFKKASTFKGFSFGKEWTIDSDIYSGCPVLSIMLKNYKASSPEASVKSGTAVKKGTTVKLTTDLKGGVIRYTTNGKNPTASSAKYTDGITINKNTTIKAAVFVNGYRAYTVTLKYTVK